MPSLLLKRIKDWATSITAFRTEDVIPVDGPNGTAKMSKDSLLKETSQNALAGSVAPAFDPTRTSENAYKFGEKVVYNGALYSFIKGHYGAWSSDDVAESILNSNWVRAGVSVNGEFVASTTRLSILGGIRVGVGAVVNVVPATGYQFVFHLFDDDGNDYCKQTDWISEERNILITRAGRFVIGVRKSDNSTILLLESYNVVVSASFNSEVEIAENKKLINHLLKEGNCDSIRTSDYEQGTYDASTGEPRPDTSRIRPKTDIRVKKGQLLALRGCGMQTVYHIYDAATNEQVAVESVWFDGDINIIAPFDIYARVAYRYTDNRTIVIRKRLSVTSIYYERTEKTENLYIGPSVTGEVNSTGWYDDGSQYRVAQRCTIALPKNNLKFKIRVPDNLDVDIVKGYAPNAMSTHIYRAFNGITVIASDTDYYMQVYFSWRASDLSAADINQNETYPITPSEVDDLISDGTIRFEIAELESENVIERNQEAEKYVKAVMLRTTSDRTTNTGLNTMPVFAHISDIHNDVYRFKNFIEYCKYLNDVDGCIVSGDMVGETNSNGLDYVVDMSDGSNMPQLVTIGNHEAQGNTTNALKEANVIDKFAERDGYEKSPDGSYYYRDFPSKKIRVISLNVYEGNVTWACNITDTQINWLVARLAELKDDLAGYGVILVYHLPAVDVESVQDKDAFFTTVRPYWQQMEASVSGISGTPITKIIDAFISKTSVSFNYVSQGVSYSISADFSEVAATTEFIAHVCGHEHSDNVGYYDGTTNIQLCLNIACAECMYGPTNYAWAANQNDVPRGYEGSVQDLFNVYAVDRAAGNVKIARVGSNMSFDMRDRKFVVIPYK